MPVASAYFATVVLNPTKRTQPVALHIYAARYRIRDPLLHTFGAGLNAEDFLGLKSMANCYRFRQNIHVFNLIVGNDIEQPVMGRMDNSVVNKSV